MYGKVQPSKQSAKLGPVHELSWSHVDLLVLVDGAAVVAATVSVVAVVSGAAVVVAAAVVVGHACVLQDRGLFVKCAAAQ